jgi:hypothetical protein
MERIPPALDRPTEDLNTGKAGWASNEAASTVCDFTHEVVDSTMTVGHGLIGGESVSVRFEKGRER